MFEVTVNNPFAYGVFAINCIKPCLQLLMLQQLCLSIIAYDNSLRSIDTKLVIQRWLEKYYS